MATRPTLEPRWMTDPNFADVNQTAEPNEGKKDVGWVGQEKPPAQYFNWLCGLLFRWVKWLNASYGANTMVLGAADMIGDGANWLYKGNSWQVTVISPPPLYIHIPLLAGQRITGARIYIKEGGTGTSYTTCQLFHYNRLTQTETSKSTAVNSADSAAGQVITLTGVTIEEQVGASGIGYYVKVTATDPVGAMQRDIYGIEVTYDWP